MDGVTEAPQEYTMEVVNRCELKHSASMTANRAGHK